MELNTAISLIRDGVSSHGDGAAIWADLGAGSGLFTRALASLLPVNSTIYAVDKDPNALNSIPWDQQGKSMIPVVSDLTSNFELPPLDGVLIANALHFLPDPVQYLTRIKSMITDRGSIIVIEYDTDSGNRWVPYPISLGRMKMHAASLRLDVKLLGTEKSKYNAGSMYSALLY